MYICMLEWGGARQPAHGMRISCVIPGACLPRSIVSRSLVFSVEVWISTQNPFPFNCRYFPNTELCVMIFLISRAQKKLCMWSGRSVSKWDSPVNFQVYPIISPWSFSSIHKSLVGVHEHIGNIYHFLGLDLMLPIMESFSCKNNPFPFQQIPGWGTWKRFISILGDFWGPGSGVQVCIWGLAWGSTWWFLSWNPFFLSKCCISFINRFQAEVHERDPFENGPFQWWFP